MQLKIMYNGQPVDCEKTEQACGTFACNREMVLKVLQSLVSPQLMPVINRIFEVQELFQLADVVSMGENQLYHVIRMCEHVIGLKESILCSLGIERENLITCALFHDSGKGKEVDDKIFYNVQCHSTKLPKILKNYGVPKWVNFLSPVHDHIAQSLIIAESYNIKGEVLEAIALHHHVKILPETLNLVAKGLYLPKAICEDILHHRPEQYAARGGNLAQTVAIIDQLCAIERKFESKAYLLKEPEKMEDELVKDLVIGVTDSLDPRVGILDNNLEGNETVILFDLKEFGVFVQQNNEYKVQAMKREVLQTIRSVIRVQDHHREKDLVGLVGGDEYAVITKVNEIQTIEKMIDRIKGAIKNRTGMLMRHGYGCKSSISANFHEARTIANCNKTTKVAAGMSKF